MSDTSNLFKEKISEFTAVIRRVREMESEGDYPPELRIFILRYALTLFDPLKKDIENQWKIAKLKSYWECRINEMKPDRVWETPFDKSYSFLMITTFEEAPGPGSSREIEPIHDKEDRDRYDKMLRADLDPCFSDQEDVFGEAGGGDISTELYSYSEMFDFLIFHFIENDCDNPLLFEAPFIYELPDDPWFMKFLLDCFN